LLTGRFSISCRIFSREKKKKGGKKKKKKGNHKQSYWKKPANKKGKKRHKGAGISRSRTCELDLEGKRGNKLVYNQKRITASARPTPAQAFCGFLHN